MTIPFAQFEEFHLVRDEDIHGNSGTGVVARGVIFPSGFTYMEWVSHVHTETRFTNIKDVELLHSHNGRTRVVMGPPHGEDELKLGALKHLAETLGYTIRKKPTTKPKKKKVEKKSE